MYDFAFLLKTYSKDIEYVKRLVESFNIYNVDSVHLFIVVDADEIDLFANQIGEKAKISLLCKEDIPVRYANGSNNTTGLSDGYINQEIVKLAFWELGLCKNYCCIDSEVEFIREFTVSEFMYDKNTPYTVLIEDHDLNVNPNYYEAYWVGRQKSLDIIKKKIGIEGQHILTCHGMQTFSGKVLADFHEKYMKPHNVDYLDLLNISPYEFTWYNYYLQKTRVIDIFPCEPQFKTYHMPYQQLFEVIQGVNTDSLKRAYCGIVINSNATDGKTVKLDEIDDIEYLIKDEKILRNMKRIVDSNRRRLFVYRIKNWIKRLIKYR